MTMKLVFDGTPTTCISTTGAITNGTFTVDATNATITQFDNSTDLWPAARCTLNLVDTFSAAPTDGSTIDLYMCRDDIDGTLDEVAPTTSDQQGATYVGSFRLYAGDVNQPKEVDVSLAGVKKCRFFFQNNSGVSISFSAGNTLKVEGFSYQDV